MGETTCKLSTESDILNKNVWGATRYLRTNYLIHNQITKSTIKLQVTIVTGTYILSIIYKYPLTTYTHLALHISIRAQVPSL